MTDGPPPDRRAGARRAIAARRRRVRTIRRRVVGLSLATFAAASGAVLVQLVSGHDPALAHTTRTSTAIRVAERSTTPSTQTTTSSSTTSSSSPSSSRATTASHSDRHRAASPSTVTTRAS